MSSLQNFPSDYHFHGIFIILLCMVLWMVHTVFSLVSQLACQENFISKNLEFPESEIMLKCFTCNLLITSDCSIRSIIFSHLFSHYFECLCMLHIEISRCNECEAPFCCRSSLIWSHLHSANVTLGRISKCSDRKKKFLQLGAVRL